MGGYLSQSIDYSEAVMVTIKSPGPRFMQKVFSDASLKKKDKIYIF